MAWASCDTVTVTPPCPDREQQLHPHFRRPLPLTAATVWSQAAWVQILPKSSSETGLKKHHPSASVSPM